MILSKDSICFFYYNLIDNAMLICCISTLCSFGVCHSYFSYLLMTNFKTFRIITVQSSPAEPPDTNPFSAANGNGSAAAASGGASASSSGGALASIESDSIVGGVNLYILAGHEAMQL